MFFTFNLFAVELFQIFNPLHTQTSQLFPLQADSHGLNCITTFLPQTLPNFIRRLVITLNLKCMSYIPV